MSVQTDSPAYPASPATARHLERPLFGHVIDGQAVPSADGAVMPVIDPSDLARAHRASRALRAGTVWVNTYQMVYPSVPYGGVKQSGHGRMLGAASLDDFTQVKSVWMKVR